MFRAVIILTLAIVLANCSAKTSCIARPGADIDVSKGETIQEKVTPRAEVSCNF